MFKFVSLAVHLQLNVELTIFLFELKLDSVCG